LDSSYGITITLTIVKNILACWRVEMGEYWFSGNGMVISRA